MILVEQSKKCLKCGILKEFSEFPKHKKVKDGHENTCKECKNARSRQWAKENRERANETRMRSYYNNIEAEHARNNEWKRNNRDKCNAHKANRKAMKHALPYTTSADTWLDVIMEYNCKCAITGKDVFDLEHFIPLSWGHGGSLKNNIYPMDSSLNSSKSNKNPYKWYKQQLKGKQRTAFEKVIHNLAKENGMTNAEFRKYVYWCEKNKRTVEEVLADNEKGLTSIDLFYLSMKSNT